MPADGRWDLIRCIKGQWSICYSILCKWPSGVQVALRTVTYREYYTRCCINTIRRPDDEHSVARNMWRNIIISLLCNVIVHQFGHLPTNRFKSLLCYERHNTWVKGRVHPRKGHDIPEEEQWYISTPSLTSALDGVSDLHHAAVALLLGMTRCPLYRKPGGPQGRCGRV